MHRAPWEAVRSQIGLEAAEFLYDSPRVERSRELADYALKSFAQRADILESAVDSCGASTGLQVRLDRNQRLDSAAPSAQAAARRMPGFCASDDRLPALDRPAGPLT